MPCNVEFRGSDSLWYCCNCGDGPLNAAHSRACTSCNDHERCSFNGLCTYVPTPPDSPLCGDRTGAQKCKGRPGEHRIPRTAFTDKTSQANPGLDVESDGRTDGIQGRSERAAELALDAPLTDVLNPIQEAIERLTNTIIESRHSLLSSVKVTPISGSKSCPSNQQAASPSQGSHQGQGGSQQKIGGLSRRHAKKASNGQRDHQESDDDAPREPSNSTAKPDPVDQRNRLLACPFCKFNPHRYRHEQCGKKGWATASKLRGHLTRVDNPHKLFDCINCFEVFPTETERHAHEELVSCEWQSMTYPAQPAQGVRSRLLRSKDKNELIPVLNSGTRATPQQQAEWWIKVYRLIHGKDAPMPDSIYHDPEDNLRRSNDATLQQDYRIYLAQTLQCQLPCGILRDATRFHLLSTLEAEVAEVQHLLSLSVPGHRSISAFKALQSWDVRPSRGASGGPAPGDAPVIQARDEPGESAANAIIISSSDADQLASSSADDQLPDATYPLDENGDAEDLFALEQLSSSTVDMDQHYNDSDPSMNYNFNISEDPPSQSQSSSAPCHSTSLNPGLFNTTSTLNWSTALPLPQRTPSFNTPPALSSSFLLSSPQDIPPCDTNSTLSLSAPLSLPHDTRLSNTTSAPRSPPTPSFPQAIPPLDPLDAGPPQKKRRLPGGEETQRGSAAMQRHYTLGQAQTPSNMHARHDFLSLSYSPNDVQGHALFGLEDSAGYGHENGLYIGGAPARQDDAEEATVEEMWAEFERDVQVENIGVIGGMS